MSQVHVDQPAEPISESLVPAEAEPVPTVLADPTMLTMPADGAKVLYVQCGAGDKIPFVCLPQISAFAELAVVEAQVSISENVEAMRSSAANQGNGRLAVETLRMMFDFFAHYMFPSELERMRHLMGAETETYGPGRVMDAITRDDAAEAMKDLLQLYGGVETTDPKDGADSSPSPEAGTGSTTSSPS